MKPETEQKPAAKKIHRVYVRSMRGLPLNPTTSAKASRKLKRNEAKVVCAKPFTIQLLHASGETVPKFVAGEDVGFGSIGVSIVNQETGEEVFSSEVELLKNQSERITERAMYRRNRRIHKTRYRAPRFDNRRRAEGSLVPSIQHKLDSHCKAILVFAGKFVPISSSVIEGAQFDIQKIKNPEIESTGYQQGVLYGFWNLREYIFHRDNHKCQNPDCKSKGKKDLILQVHHIGFWKNDRTDRPENLITLCVHCHRSENHKANGFLFGREPKLKNFRPETFMSTIYWRLINKISEVMPTTRTFGYITKGKRISLAIEKSHANDAYVIALGGCTKEIETETTRSETFYVKQSRRNNRSLSNWRDAKYIDIRTGEAASASELNCGRRTRNQNLNTENLRKFRGEKLSIGCVRTRKQRYSYQPLDQVRFDNKNFSVAGVQNKGAYIKLKDLAKPVRTDAVRPYRFITGMAVI